MAISVVVRVRVASDPLMKLPRQRVRDGLHGGDRAALDTGGGSGRPPRQRRHGTHDGGREDIATETKVPVESYSVFQYRVTIQVGPNLLLTSKQ